jgi:hypothetical protein
MKARRFSFAGMMLVLALPVLAMAADATDPAVGTWKLDVAKSTYHGMPAPKSEMRTYEATADGMKLTSKIETASGEQTGNEVTYKYDGKDYPISGSKLFDTVAVSRVDSHTAKSVLKKGGKQVGHFTRVVSHDGKTLTTTTKVTGPGGEAISERQVYTRQ